MMTTSQKNICPNLCHPSFLPSCFQDKAGKLIREGKDKYSFEFRSNCNDKTRVFVCFFVDAVVVAAAAVAAAAAAASDYLFSTVSTVRKHTVTQIP